MQLLAECNLQDDSTSQNDPVSLALRLLAGSKANSGSKRGVEDFNVSDSLPTFSAPTPKRPRAPTVDPMFAPSKPATLISEDSLLIEPDSSPALSSHNLTDSMLSILEGDDYSFNPISATISAATMDVKIKRKIWLGQYIDLGCLAPPSDIKPKEQQNLLLSLTNSKPRFRPPFSIDEWRRWFCIYATIYTTRYYKSAPQLFEYINRIYGLQAKSPNTYIWRLYDEEFRKRKAADPSLDWHEINEKCLRAVEEQHMVWLQKKQNFNNNSSSGSNDKKSSSNLPKNGTCNFWNKNDNCRSRPGSCKYKHVCTWCKGDHRAPHCTANAKNK